MNSSYGTGFGQQEEEIFYSTYEPTKEEILEYAVKIGIDPDKETNLIYLARQGLLHPLPENWKPCYSKQVKAYYYYDRYTKKSQWEHPIDVLYRARVVDARKALSLERSDSTSLGDSGFRSLKSIHNKCDPSSTPSDAIYVSQSACSSTSQETERNERQKWPPKAVDSPSSKQTEEVIIKPKQIEGGEDDDESDSNKENNSQEAVMSRARSPCMGIRDSGMALSSKLSFNVGINGRDATAMGEEPTLGSRYGSNVQSFTITGKGSQFLKSNKKTELDVRKTETEVKGILRDSSLTYVRNKITPNEDSGSDERKSVRFDIDLNAELKANKVETVRDDSLTNLEEIEEGYDNDADNKLDRVEAADDDDDDDASEDESDEKVVVEQHIANKKAYRQDDKFQPEEDMKAQSSSDSEQNSEVPVISNRLKQRVASQDEQINMATIQSNNKLDANREEACVQQLKQTIDFQRGTYRARLEEELRSLEAQEEANIQNQLTKVHNQYNEQLEQEKQRLKELHRQNIEEIKEFYQVKLTELKADYEEENAKDYTIYKETLQEEFDRRVKEVTDQHRATMTTLQKNHDEIVEELERDLKMEEELLKKEHATNLTEMKIKLSHELEVERQRMRETGEDRLYEKVRCEKRLLEDKYKCLKEKYTRLKTDVRISLERRKKRREQQQHSLLSNSYETDDRTNSKPLPPHPYEVGNKAGVVGPSSAVGTSEKSSISTPPPGTSKRFSVKSNYLLDGKNKLLHFNGTAGASEPRKPLMLNYNNNINNNNNNTNNNSRALHTDDTSQSEATYSKNYFQIRNIFANIQCEDNLSSDSEFDKNNRGKGGSVVSGSVLVEPTNRPKRKIFTKTKSASTSKLNATKHERDAGGRPCTPVENLRIQLKKLEELEDQIPDCNLDAPYHLRYPFVHEHVENAGAGNASAGNGGTGGVGGVGSSNGSSELEFFKHRILLERDSVMRAKESLRAQKHLFKTKQHDISIKHALKNKHTMDQIFNEEKELTEMEVSLHRTRALLGEKVIRLRHLERSLQKLADKERPKLRTDTLDRVMKPKETLSDLSSYSSSGFSSNELPTTDHNYAHVRTMNVDPNDAFKCLEHLHAEIQEIWSLLNPTTSTSAAADFDEMDFLNNTSTFIGNNRICDMALPPTPADPISAGKLASVASPIGQQPLANQAQHQRHRYTVNLLEKTRDLKNWLRQAKSEHETLKKKSFG